MRPTYLRALRKARAQTQAMALHPGQGVSDIMDISSDLNTERLAPVVTALVTGAGTGTAYQNPAHDHSSKKRDAPCEMSGEYAGPLPDAKREDNGDHADKTVNLDDFWNAKRGSLGIHPQEGGTLLVDTPDVRKPSFVFWLSCSHILGCYSSRRALLRGKYHRYPAVPARVHRGLPQGMETQLSPGSGVGQGSRSQQGCSY